MAYKTAYPALIIAAVVIIAIILAYFFPGIGLKAPTEEIFLWVSIMVTAALFVGLINVTRMHYRIISRRTEGFWIPSILFLATLYIVLIAGIFGGGTSNAIVAWMRSTIYERSETAINSLLGPIVLAAAYRVIKIRSVEVFVFAMFAFFVIMQNAPIGGVIWSQFPLIGEWVQLNPMSGGIRGLAMIISMNLMVMGLRFLLGYERTLLGVVEEA